MPLEKREIFPDRFRYVCGTCTFMWPSTPVPEPELPPPPKHRCPNTTQVEMKRSLAAPQKIREEVMPRPVSVCTHCGAVSYDMTQLNGRCKEQLAGTRCVGVNGSARGEGDWKRCEKCAGSGSAKSASCGYCNGSGWIYARR